MTYPEFQKIEKILKKQKINCFIDQNHWETRDGYVLYFHKITHAKKTVELFTKVSVETYDILPNILNAYFKYILVVKPSENFEKFVAVIRI